MKMKSARVLASDGVTATSGAVGIGMPRIGGGEIPVVAMLRPLGAIGIDLAGVEALAL